MPVQTEPVNLLKLENQVCFALAVASRSVNAVYRPLLEPLGLTHPQYLVMLALWDRSPRSVKDLGETLQLEPATLSPLLKRLEAIGYVRRRRSEADERMLELTLTDAGVASAEPGGDHSAPDRRAAGHAAGRAGTAPRVAELESFQLRNNSGRRRADLTVD